MKLKVCGLNNRENTLQVLECKPDYVGFIFYAKSPRFVGDLSPEFVSGIDSAKKVGVFVNETEINILDKVSRYGLDYVQLHGDETPEFCALINRCVPVIKAFQIADDFDFSVLNDYEASCDHFLFDSKSKNYGGSGKGFNHEKLKEYKLNKPFFLSGGIDIETISDLVLRLSSLVSRLSSLVPLVALDVNSRFEISPGIKDEKKIKVLTEKLRNNELLSR